MDLIYSFLAIYEFTHRLSAQNAMKKKTKESPNSWQSHKSSLTRDRIVIATLEAIVQFGYESTTMVKIAKLASVSQGSMQYHFPAKIDAIKAAISYLLAKRLNDHQQDLETRPDESDAMGYSIEVYWRHLNEGHYVAYQDLVIAARTHPELAEVLKPAYQRFIKTWRQDAQKLVPEWEGKKDMFELICDIGQYQMEGLAYGRLNGQISEEQTRRVLDFTKNMLSKMTAEL